MKCTLLILSALNRHSSNTESASTTSPTSGECERQYSRMKQVKFVVATFKKIEVISSVRYVITPFNRNCCKDIYVYSHVSVTPTVRLKWS